MLENHGDEIADEARMRYLNRDDQLPRWAPSSSTGHWESVEDILRFLQTKVAIILTANKTCIVKTGRGKKCEFKFLSKDAVSSKLSGMHFQYTERTPDGPVFKIYRGDDYWKDNRQTWFDSVVFDPTDRDCIKSENYSCFNMYTGMAFEPDDQFNVDSDRIRPFMRHLQSIMAANNVVMGSFLLDWCAHIIQHPGTKPESCCLFLSVQGTGKGVFWSIVSKLLGPELVATASSKHRLLGNFNSHLTDKILVLVDEVMFGGEHAANNQIKNMITDKTMVVERKGIDSMTRRSCERYVFMSNEDWPLRVEASDRRSACFEVSAEKVGDREYFAQLNEHFEDKTNLEHVFQLLWQHRPNGNPVSQYLMPPDSQLKDQLKAMCRDEYVAFLKDLVDNDNGCEGMDVPIDGSAVCSAMLINLFEIWCVKNGKDPRKASTTAMGRTLKKILGNRVAFRYDRSVSHGYIMSATRIQSY